MIYITPKDKLDGLANTILAERDAKLAEAREARKTGRQQHHRTSSGGFDVATTPSPQPGGGVAQTKQPERSTTLCAK